MRPLGTLAPLLVLGLAAPVAAQRPASQAIVWPAAPETARIRYVGSLRSEADINRRESFLKRLGRWLSGGRGTALYALQRPFDVVVGPGERYYLTNGSVPRVIVFDPGARKARFLGEDVPGGLGKPMGLGLGPDGSVYVADAGRRRVVVFDSSGHYVRAFGGAAHLLNPVDVAVAGDRAWVVDSYLHQVVAFDGAGEVVGRVGKAEGTLAGRDTRRGARAAERPGHEGGAPAGFTPDDLSDVWQNRGKEPGEFRYPVAVAMAPDGTMYVSDQLNFRVQAFDPDGRFLRQVGRLGDQPGSFTRPKGVAVDSEGHLYVVDGSFSNVQVFDTQGRLLLAFGRLGNGEGEHWLPIGIAIDARDRILVADRYNNRVQIYQYLASTEPEAAAPGGR
ncbi:MAG: hypothetical protein KBF47_00350 [Gemmatimonadales bacterium]|nr:hypothetical protein [Gemmatimonadales bacterium]